MFFCVFFRVSDVVVTNAAWKTGNGRKQQLVYLIRLQPEDIKPVSKITLRHGTKQLFHSCGNTASLLEYLGTRSLIFSQIVQRVRDCIKFHRNTSNSWVVVRCNKPSGTSGRPTPNTPSQSFSYSPLNTHPPKCVGCHQWFWNRIADCWVSAANPKCLYLMNEERHSTIISPCKITWWSWRVYRQQPTNPP